jgi:hypothetical protein
MVDLLRKKSLMKDPDTINSMPSNFLYGKCYNSLNYESFKTLHDEMLGFNDDMINELLQKDILNLNFNKNFFSVYPDSSLSFTTQYGKYSKKIYWHIVNNNLIDSSIMFIKSNGLFFIKGPLFFLKDNYANSNLFNNLFLKIINLFFIFLIYCGFINIFYILLIKPCYDLKSLISPQFIISTAFVSNALPLNFLSCCENDRFLISFVPILYIFGALSLLSLYKFYEQNN